MKQAFVNECPDWSFPAEYESEHRFSISDYVRPDTRFGRFVRRNAILLIALVGLMLWTWAIGTICYHNGKVDATERVTAQYEEQLAAEIQAVRDEYAAKAFTADDASRQAAMNTDAGWIAKLLYPMKDNNEKDLRTAVWCVLNRVDNKYYPDSVEEVCCQKEQWMGFSADNPVLTDLKQIALEEVEQWYSGERPVSSDFVYLYWTSSKITLRDTWQDSSLTNYWRYGQ